MFKHNTNKIITAGLILASCYIQQTNAADINPYDGMKFYYGDNHTHTGFSGDNKHDSNPLAALTNAVNSITNHIKSNAFPTTNMTDVGGYFLFLSDHLQYIPTRPDMGNCQYDMMKKYANDKQVDISGPDYTFTAFPGGELTGVARNGLKYMPWDDKFGHMNLFNINNLSPFIELDLTSNIKGTTAMNRAANISGAIGQINHSGYNKEPRFGNDSGSLYPYTNERDKVFKFFEVTDGKRTNWDIGAAQYNLCLQKGYHVSPVVGSDFHDTKKALTFSSDDNRAIARTVIIAPSTLGKSLETRRNILLNAVRNNMVYATESPNMRLLFTVNNMPMGHRFANKPNQLAVMILAYDPIGNDIQSVELLQNKRCETTNLKNEYQCVKVLKKWSAAVATFNGQITFQMNSLSDLKYVYVKVTQKNGNRTMTSPVYF